MVDTLECVGDRRSWPWGVRMVGRGEEELLSLSLSAPSGLGEMGGNRKSGVLRSPREVEEDEAEEGGEDKPAALLCDRLRFILGRSRVERSGEEADKTMGGGLSAAPSGENRGISMSGTPRFDRTSR